MTDTKEKLEQGYIQCRTIIEMLGKPKEHVDETLKKYIEHIKNSIDIEILKQDFAEVKESKENKGFWASFVELELLVKNFPTLIGFCFDFMPSSIEIIAPTELKLKETQLSNIMNDLQGKLHKLDMMVKQLNTENQFIKNNLNFLATNFISVLLNNGIKDIKTLAKVTGMSEENMNAVLEGLIKKNLVKKQDDSYTWIKKDVKREE